MTVLRKAAAAAALTVALATAATAPASAVGRGSGSPEACTPPHGCETIRDTDAPLRVRVGAMSTHSTITVLTRAPSRQMTVALSDPGVSVPGWGSRGAPEPGRPTVFEVQIDIAAVNFERWGQHDWHFAGFRVDGPGDTVGTEIRSTMPVDVRAHSMLGMATSRSGGAVQVRGSLRAFNTTAERYASWSGRPVSLQRLAADGRWVQVAGITTDRNGDVATRIAVPTGTQLRFVTPDTPTIWGAASAPQRT